MASITPNHFFYLLVTKQINFSSDTFKIKLMTSGFSFDRDADTEWADVSASELADGFGYTTGGSTLANVVVTEDDTEDRTSVVWDSVDWAASGGSIGPCPGAIIIDDTVADDPIVAYIEFSEEKTQVDGSDFTVATPGFYIQGDSTDQSTPSNHIYYLLATKSIDFSADVFKIRLMATGFTFNKDTHELWANASASEHATGNGYTTGGNTLAGVAIAENDTDDRVEIFWNDTYWIASGADLGPTPGAIIIDDTVANDPIVGYINFGGEQTLPDGGKGTITNPGVYIGAD